MARFKMIGTVLFLCKSLLANMNCHGYSSIQNRLYSIEIWSHADSKRFSNRESLQLSQCMRFPTMWYVRPSKP